VDDVREQILVAVQQLQAASDALDEAAAVILGINRTDLRACSVLAAAGRVTVSALAAETGLSRGAMTTALDRLEDKGYVRRIPSPDDRRSVLVELTAKIRRKAAPIWGPLARDGRAALESYAASELETIARFLQRTKELQAAHADRIRRMAGR
jgi:DNA-binding MarR family transcriptional regulator